MIKTNPLKLQKISLIIFTLLILSCQGELDKQSSDVADDICKCYQPLVDLNAEIQSMLQKNQEEEAENMISKVSEINKEGKKCTLNILNKYGADTKINVDNISTQMKETCPKIVDIVSPFLFDN